MVIFEAKEGEDGQVSVDDVESTLVVGVTVEEFRLRIRRMTGALRCRAVNGKPLIAASSIVNIVGRPMVNGRAWTFSGVVGGVSVSSTLARGREVRPIL